MSILMDKLIENISLAVKIHQNRAISDEDMRVLVNDIWDLRRDDSDDIIDKINLFLLEGILTIYNTEANKHIEEHPKLKSYISWISYYHTYYMYNDMISGIINRFNYIMNFFEEQGEVSEDTVLLFMLTDFYRNLTND